MDKKKSGKPERACRFVTVLGNSVEGALFVERDEGTSNGAHAVVDHHASQGNGVEQHHTSDCQENTGETQQDKELITQVDGLRNIVTEENLAEESRGVAEHDGSYSTEECDLGDIAVDLDHGEVGEYDSHNSSDDGGGQSVVFDQSDDGLHFALPVQRAFPRLFSRMMALTPSSEFVCCNELYIL